MYLIHTIKITPSLQTIKSQLTPWILYLQISINLLPGMPHSSLHIRAKLLRQLTPQKYNIVLVPYVTVQVILTLFLYLVRYTQLCVGLVTVVVLVRDVDLDFT